MSDSRDVMLRYLRLKAKKHQKLMSKAEQDDDDLLFRVHSDISSGYHRAAGRIQRELEKKRFPFAVK